MKLYLNDEINWETLETGETLIFDPVTSCSFLCNEEATAIMTLCTGKEEDVIVKEYVDNVGNVDVPLDAIQEGARRFLKELLHKRVIIRK
mgnify:CR=1 FL=1